MSATKKETKPEARQCQDGCGGTPRGARSRFLPGHDARLRGVLLRAAEATGADATEAERAEATAAVAALPDPEWAARWWSARHPGDAERAAANAARWDV